MHSGGVEGASREVHLRSYKRMPIIEEERIRGAPDLVVEILFPSTGYYDLRIKYRVYEKMWRVSSRPQQNATRHP